MKSCIGIDIGGSMIKWGLIDQAGEIRESGKCPTEPQQGFASFVEKLVGIIDNLNDAGPVGIGVSTPGFVDPHTGQIVGGIHNIPFLQGENLKEQLMARQPLPVEVLNDVKAAALGERWVGAASRCDSLFCVTIGTGIGGCLVVDGRIYEGAHFHAGEMGFMRYRSEGEYLETDCSGKGLLQAAREALGNPGLTAGAFFDGLREGSARHQKVFHRWLDCLGAALAEVLIVTDPEMLVIGGGITENGALLLTPLQAAIRRHMPAEFAQQYTIKLAQRRNDAGMLGAAYNLMKKRNIID